MRARRRQQGFTLVEILVGLAITAMIALVLSQTFLVGYRVLSTEAREIAADQAISAASLSLTRDLSSGQTTSALPVTLTPSSGTLTLTYGSPAVAVTYTIDANKNLIRTVGGAARVQSRGLQQLMVSAGAPACSLTVTLLPSATGASSQTLLVGERSLGCF